MYVLINDAESEPSGCVPTADSYDLFIYLLISREQTVNIQAVCLFTAHVLYYSKNISKWYMVSKMSVFNKECLSNVI